MEVVAADERAVAVEVDADLVPGPALRTAALVREARERRGLYWHVGPFPVACRRRLAEARANAIIDEAFRRGIAREPALGAIDRGPCLVTGFPTKSASAIETNLDTVRFPWDESHGQRAVLVSCRCSRL